MLLVMMRMMWLDVRMTMGGHDAQAVNDSDAASMLLLMLMSDDFGSCCG